ncbi:MAG: Hsp20/alpha crystallin family protein [Rubrobacter sp.]|nr:Hsp20/alpha crystallin family protein [Rubrobacter sp.]
MDERGPDPSQIHQRHTSRATAWTPEVEVIAEEDNLLILMDLPGVRPEDVEIALSGGLLTISGQKGERQTGGEHYVRERRVGTFRGSLTLPSEGSESTVDTNLEDGVLEITVENYAGASEPRRLQVRSPRKET